MEYMYDARRGYWPDGSRAIEVTLPGTDGETTLLDTKDPDIVESDLGRGWIIMAWKIPGSWPDDNEEVYGCERP